MNYYPTVGSKIFLCACMVGSMKLQKNNFSAEMHDYIFHYNISLEHVTVTLCYASNMI